MFSVCSNLQLPEQVENVLIIFHVLSGRESGFRLFYLFPKPEKIPQLCDFSLWEVFQLALATRVSTVLMFASLQLCVGGL